VNSIDLIHVSSREFGGKPRKSDLIVAQGRLYKIVIARPALRRHPLTAVDAISPTRQIGLN
jgi:hypothetical protein